ncbi:hypothetical protein HII36_28480 [Nonomuraea sp. NN258]|uniref:SRPBCC domain-containing protein n=1 Tax=Nonomuraea antri TaxID=2730852 RepID=UPI00156987AB|nr:SRPBCC domain-containing protein [Nonomuraea antri]NRQ35740.1 hypothetical protein [Nonomuraea antri]
MIESNAPTLADQMRQTFISATPDRIWRALTDPVESAAWYFDTGIHSTWEPGAPYAYRFADGRTAISGTIERAEPPYLLSMTFSAQWTPQVAADPASRVIWRIEAEAEGSTVTVEHLDIPAGTTTAMDIATGWPYLLRRLKKYVETAGSDGE